MEVSVRVAYKKGTAGLANEASKKALVGVVQQHLWPGLGASMQAAVQGEPSSGQAVTVYKGPSYFGGAIDISGTDEDTQAVILSPEEVTRQQQRLLSLLL